MINYVLGFARTPCRQFVYLIRKRRPEWQAGLLNGIGGKLEPGEYPIDAMVREFREEAGVDIAPARWRDFAQVTGRPNEGGDYEGDWRVCCFSVDLFNGEHPHTMEDEEISAARIDILSGCRIVPNLSWLVPMAFSAYPVHADVKERR